MLYLVVALISDLLAAPTEIIVISKLKDVWHEIVRLDRKILDNHVHHWIGDLDPRNWHVIEVCENAGNDGVGSILKQMFLECQLPVRVVSEVVEEFLQGVPKCPILGVLIELFAEEFEFADNPVGVVTVALAEQEVPFVIELAPLLGGRIFKDEALLTEASSIMVSA